MRIGMRGRGGTSFGITGLDKIDGVVMGYEMKGGNGFELKMEVIKIALDPVIEDKVFDTPKGYDIRPMKEMQGQFDSMGGQRRNN